MPLQQLHKLLQCEIDQNIIFDQFVFNCSSHSLNITAMTRKLEEKIILTSTISFNLVVFIWRKKYSSVINYATASIARTMVA